MSTASPTVLWHLGRCLSYGDGVAYWALAEMVRQRLRIPEDAPARGRATSSPRGWRLGPRRARSATSSRPRLGALLGVAEPGLGREELFAGWRLFFERLAAHEPVMMVFEDMQWADQGLLEFVEQLLDWSPSADLHVPWPALSLPRGVKAGRRAGEARRPSSGAARGPGHAELLAAWWTACPPRRSRASSSVPGVPLYAIEIVRALADRGTLRDEDGRLVASGELGELEVPASLNALWRRGWMHSMTPSDSSSRRSRCLAARFPVSPRRYWPSPGGEADVALAGLVRKQVLVIRADALSPDRGQYAFAQGLLRTVAYDMLSRRERKQRHLAAAEHLSQAFPNSARRWRR